MLKRLGLLLIVLVLAGCSSLLPGGPNPPVPNEPPPTSAPVPPTLPAPPRPTATLVISNVSNGTQPGAGQTTGTSGYRRFPELVFGKIGLWGDTGSLTLDQAKGTAGSIQVVSGRHALAVRGPLSRLVALARIDGTKPADEVKPGQVGAFDGVLIESVGLPEKGDSGAAANRLFSGLRPQLGARLLIADTYAWTDGAAYAKHTAEVNPLLAQLDGACVCRFLRAPDAALDKWKTVAEWKADVDAVAALTGQADKLLLVATPLAKVGEGQMVAVDQWFNYAFASYLLAANGGRAYFSYQGPSADDYMAGPAAAAQLGYPFGGYTQMYGAYVRQFQQGMVAVNPGSIVVEIPLARTYVTGSGQQVSRIKLEPHSGAVLTAVK